MRPHGSKRGVPLPAIGTCAAVMAAACAAWLLWGEIRGPLSVPEPAIDVEPPDSPAVLRIQALEELVSRGPAGIPEHKTPKSRLA